MREIKLTKGMFALVDDEDYEYLNQFTWHTEKTKHSIYARGWVNSSMTSMHRLIMNINERHTLVDHIDGYGLNNQRNNLRVATYSQNMANRKIIKPHSSAFLGVHWVEACKKWRAAIKKDGKQIPLGFFVNEKDAAKAYNEAAIKYHKEFAFLNKV